MRRIRLKRLSPAAVVPSRATEGSLHDLQASEEAVLRAEEVTKVPTGLSLEVPRGHTLFLRDRSSLALLGLQVVGGVIDSDYRGEIFVLIRNHGRRAHVVSPGDRVAQLQLARDLLDGFDEATSLSETARAAGGFGSTGK